MSLIYTIRSASLALSRTTTLECVNKSGTVIASPLATNMALWMKLIVTFNKKSQEISCYTCSAQPFITCSGMCLPLPLHANVTRINFLLLILCYKNNEIVFGAAGFVSFGNSCVMTCTIMAMSVYVPGLRQCASSMINYNSNVVDLHNRYCKPCTITYHNT